MPSSSIAPWRKSTDGGGLERPAFGFDHVLAQWYYLFGGLGEPNVGFLVSAPPSWHENDLETATKIKNAWLATLVDVPDLACTISSEPVQGDPNPLGGLKVCYTPLSNDEDINRWLEATLNVSNAAVSLNEMRERSSTAPLLGQLNNQHSYPVRLDVGLRSVAAGQPKHAFFLRSNHLLFDGPGSLVILNQFFDKLCNGVDDSQAVRDSIKLLTPPAVTPRLRHHALDVVNLSRKEYDEATLDGEVGRRLMESKVGLPLHSDFAGKPKAWPTNAPPTEALHLTLPAEVSSAFLKECKSRGLTATYGLGAALLIAGLELFRPNGDEGGTGPVDAAILVIFNLRRWMNEGDRLQKTASSAETSVLCTTSAKWDAAIASGLKGEARNEEVFWTFAKDLERFFTHHVSNISSFAGKGAHDFWNMYNEGAVAMATGAIPTVPSTGFGLNSVGILENFIKVTHSGRETSLELHESLVAMRAASIVTQPHIWTFRNELHVNMSFIRQMFVSGTPEKLAERLFANVAIAAGRSPADVHVFQEDV